MSQLDTAFTRQVGVSIPLICGAMYPCSNPELVAAVSAAGGIGVIQPLSIVYAHGHSFREGLRIIRRITDKPVGFNALIEQGTRVERNNMRGWIETALEEGVRFFVTALGNPRWVCDLVHQSGGVVYHNVTERKWALKALDGGVDGFNCVNADAGGHAGDRTPPALLDELSDLGVPLICAGGIGDEQRFVEALEMGYAGVQMGTRFIAASECSAHPDYQRAIVKAQASDIVHTEKISGTACAVINTPYIQKVGTKAGPVAKILLRRPRAKRLMRLIYGIRSLWQLRRASLHGLNYKDYFQAGRSVRGITAIEPAGDIVRRFAAAAKALDEPGLAGSAGSDEPVPPTQT
jgi:nitronate monooxygenase